MEPKDRIIVALDVSSLEDAKPLVESLASHVGYFKVGLEILTAVGAPEVVRMVRAFGGKVFYDGKFKDIPNTVASAVRAVTHLGVDMFDVHCFGGRKMMEAARKAAEKVVYDLGQDKPIILGVTLLTSLDHDDLVSLGICSEVNIHNLTESAAIKQERIERLVVRHLAHLAQESGLDGVIASPQEIGAIRKYCQPEFLVVTPGVRPLWTETNDQKRVMTPAEAIKAGADYLVIGRPITKPPKEIGTPVDAVKRIIDEITPHCGGK